MKKIFFYVMIATVVLTAASCNKDDENEIEPGQNQITITGQNVNMAISVAGSGTMTIDWGDWTGVETYSLPGFSQPQTYSHVYSGNFMHTITLTGDKIEYLECIHQNILLLDVSRNPTLTELHCGWNWLTSLDVSRNTALVGFSCYLNYLTDIDVSKNTELYYLNCQTNLLTELDVSTNSMLRLLYCEANQLTSEALNAMFGTLHNNTITGLTKEVRIGANPGTNDCNASIAENKGWSVVK